MITLTRSTKNRDICFDKDIRASNHRLGCWPEMRLYMLVYRFPPQRGQKRYRKNCKMALKKPLAVMGVLVKGRNYSSIASLMQSTMYITSLSVTYGPAGRHMPTLKMASLTPLT